MHLDAKPKWSRRAVFAGAVFATAVLTLGAMQHSARAQYGYHGYGYAGSAYSFLPIRIRVIPAIRLTVICIIGAVIVAAMPGVGIWTATAVITADGAARQ